MLDCYVVGGGIRIAEQIAVRIVGDWGLRMRWLILALAVGLAGCKTTAPTQRSGSLDIQAGEEQESGAEPSSPVPDPPTANRMGFPARFERTWGDPSRPATSETLGEKLAQGTRASLWTWTECNRFHVSTTAGGPRGNGQIVETDSPARYRLWSLDPLTVEVEIGGVNGETDNRFDFLDHEGKPFVPRHDGDFLAVKVEGPETLLCDRDGQTEVGNDWLWCSDLVVVAANGLYVTGQGEHQGGVRMLKNDVIEWTTSSEGRGGLAAHVSGVRCHGQSLPGVPRVSSRKPRHDCSDPNYQPGLNHWKRLPPADVAQTSDGCVGYCFRAFIDSTAKESPDVVRVAILDEGSALARATLSRSVVAASTDTEEGRREPLRFACFDKSDGSGVAPHFDDCVQMEADPADDWACLTASKAFKAKAGKL